MRSGCCWPSPRCCSTLTQAAIDSSLSRSGSVSSPGSHDSFSFYIDEASPVGPEQPETVQNFVSVFGTVAKKLMRKWLATQTMNFNSQLEAGIRFFDLRISTKPRDPDNELFFAHGLFSATVSRDFCWGFFFISLMSIWLCSRLLSNVCAVLFFLGGVRMGWGLVRFHELVGLIIPGP